jgi:hypothetical protein
VDVTFIYRSEERKRVKTKERNKRKREITNPKIKRKNKKIKTKPYRKVVEKCSLRIEIKL